MNPLPVASPRSWPLSAAAVIAGLLGGACSAGLIALINTSLHHPSGSPSLLALGFLGLVLGRIAANAASRLLLNHVMQRTIAELCRDLSRRVLATPLWQLERVGGARILATLTDDVAMIAWAAQNVPSLAMNAAIVAGCAVYLGRLSWQLLIIAACATLLGSVVYRTLIRRAYASLQHARDTRDALFQHFRGLTDGIKELKLHAARRTAFFHERIVPATEGLRRDALTGIRHHVAADSWSQLIYYCLIGGMLLPYVAVPSVSAETRSGYVLTMLYAMTPVWAIMEAWSIFARARIALQKIRDLGLSLDGAETERTQASQESLTPWHRVDLDGVTFAYPVDSEGRGFALGPLDMTLHRSELVFLVGGNGSGKSTLVKVLTGLYPVQAGTIRLDGQPLTDENREYYCRHFSAVFSDFYLFDSLLGLNGEDLDARANSFLADLELENKVHISGGVLSTTALSQGQRKRLALLTAFLEDRPIYVFDEWAADQDPYYREIFYRRLLPQLRSRGKTILVISHDERYFHLGDRVIRLEYGKIKTETSTQAVVVT